MCRLRPCGVPQSLRRDADDARAVSLGVLMPVVWRPPRSTSRPLPPGEERHIPGTAPRYMFRPGIAIRCAGGWSTVVNLHAAVTDDANVASDAEISSSLHSAGGNTSWSARATCVSASAMTDCGSTDGH